MRNHAPKWMLCVALLSLGIMSPASAVVVPITAIQQIIGGTTIDFETATGSNGPASVALDQYGVSATRFGSSAPASYTSLVSWVIGNAAAPITKHALANQVRLTPTTPWRSVGITGISAFFGETGDANMKITAFGQSGQALGSLTRLFDSKDQMEGYNGSAVFVGLASDEPIYRVDLTATLLFLTQSPENIVWDHLTFFVPEPGAALVVALTMTLLSLRSRGGAGPVRYLQIPCNPPQR